jgi:hypothetical protein
VGYRCGGKSLRYCRTSEWSSPSEEDDEELEEEEADMARRAAQTRINWKAEEENGMGNLRLPWMLSKEITGKRG